MTFDPGFYEPCLTTHIRFLFTIRTTNSDAGADAGDISLPTHCTFVRNCYPSKETAVIGIAPLHHCTHTTCCGHPNLKQAKLTTEQSAMGRSVGNSKAAVFLRQPQCACIRPAYLCKQGFHVCLYLGRRYLTLPHLSVDLPDDMPDLSRGHLGMLVSRRMHAGAPRKTF